MFQPKQSEIEIKGILVRKEEGKLLLEDDMFPYIETLKNPPKEYWS